MVAKKRVFKDVDKQKFQEHKCLILRGAVQIQTPQISSKRLFWRPGLKTGTDLRAEFGQDADPEVS